MDKSGNFIAAQRFVLAKNRPLDAPIEDEISEYLLPWMDLVTQRKEPTIVSIDIVDAGNELSPFTLILDPKWAEENNGVRKEVLHHLRDEIGGEFRGVLYGKAHMIRGTGKISSMKTKELRDVFLPFAEKYAK